ncbi:MAG: hypothetical protein JWN86_798 [Planctomycetota bacterium]|nr:hypothetical protein [Planctomycetota bacterium]
MTAKRLSMVALLAVLLFDVWWRSHTIAGTVRETFGFAPWPVVAQAEPLDCDEAIYAYIGKRLVAGDVMYRDLTENKPPLGYWLFALAVRIGGASETCIRLMPVPMVLATIALVWWIAGRLAGPLGAAIAAWIYALMSTDPYLYGNGANLEHAINLFGAAALALMVLAWPGKSRWPLFAAGVCVGAASLVKQVAIAPLLVFAFSLFLRQSTPRSALSRVRDVAALLAGFSASWAMAVSVLVLQGAGRAAFEDIVRYGGALATVTPRDPKEYPFFVRWLVGNTDPNGLLPWPFGATRGRAWWAAGSWPIWAVSVPSLIWSGLANRGERRLVAAWTLAAWVAVALPGLFWQHYYLVPLPGVAVLVAVTFADSLRAIVSRPRLSRAWIPGVASFLIFAAVLASFRIQIRDYLLVEPIKITERYKGGGQWVVLREIGLELGRRTRSWTSPHLFVWGIQSPLYLYSGLDGVTPQVFADPLITAFSERDAPLVRPRIDRTMRDLRTRRPDLIFVGQRPFPALLGFLREHYLHTDLVVRGTALPLPPDGSGLWVRRDRFREYERPAD